MNMLIAARVIQGMGGGGLVVLVNIAISKRDLLFRHGDDC